MCKNIEFVLDKIRDAGWSVEQEDENCYRIGHFSPAGQDFGISVCTENDPEHFVENIRVAADDFDVSYEAYIWLDNTGHGTHGAPYDMRDVYEDMELCKGKLLELYNYLYECLCCLY